jgi:hypothetical protein
VVEFCERYIEIKILLAALYDNIYNVVDVIQYHNLNLEPIVSESRQHMSSQNKVVFTECLMLSDHLYSPNKGLTILQMQSACRFNNCLEHVVTNEIMGTPL